jgi:hypothetical protein
MTEAAAPLCTIPRLPPRLGFAVDGTHSYAEEGQYQVGVTINDVGGSTASATSSVNIADAALTASSTTVSGTEGAAISGATVATFTDANPNATATVAGLAPGNHIDLADISFGAHTTLGYTPNDSNSGVVLTAGDGSHVAKIALLGQYSAASFVMASDGHGGTLITDRPELIAQTQLTKPHG